MEVIALPNNEGKSVKIFLKKNILSRFDTPRAMIGDGGCHFCCHLFKVLIVKYGVKHNVEAPYHMQTSGKVKVSTWEIKSIFGEDYES